MSVGKGGGEHWERLFGGRDCGGDEGRCDGEVGRKTEDEFEG